MHPASGNPSTPGGSPCRGMLGAPRCRRDRAPRQPRTLRLNEICLIAAEELAGLAPDPIVDLGRKDVTADVSKAERTVLVLLKTATLLRPETPPAPTQTPRPVARRARQVGHVRPAGRGGDRGDAAGRGTAAQRRDGRRRHAAEHGGDANWEDVTDHLRGLTGFSVLSVRDAMWRVDGIPDPNSVTINFDVPSLTAENRAARSSLCASAPLGELGGPRQYQVTLMTTSNTDYDAKVTVTARSASEASELALVIDKQGIAPWQSNGSDDVDTCVESVQRVRATKAAGA